MTDKRFMTQYGIKIYDLHKGNEYLVNEVDAQEIVDLLNRLNMTVKERGRGMSTLQKKIDELHEEKQLQDERISLLSSLLDLADAIIDTSDNEKAKSVWENKNEDFERKWEELND